MAAHHLVSLKSRVERAEYKFMLQEYQAFQAWLEQASEDDLQDPRWCREHARRMHKYLVGHCAWGVYSELRQIMATENKLADERAKVAKGREHVG